MDVNMTLSLEDKMTWFFVIITYPSTLKWLCFDVSVILTNNIHSMGRLIFHFKILMYFNFSHVQSFYMSYLVIFGGLPAQYICVTFCCSVRLWENEEVKIALLCPDSMMLHRANRLSRNLRLTPVLKSTVNIQKPVVSHWALENLYQIQ